MDKHKKDKIKLFGTSFVVGCVIAIVIDILVKKPANQEEHFNVDGETLTNAIIYVDQP